LTSNLKLLPLKYQSQLAVEIICKKVNVVHSVNDLYKTI
jgi:hypothetical protein